jgi:hypothetical protein
MPDTRQPWAWWRWYPCVELSGETDRATFARIAERLCAEFGAAVTERYGGAGDDEKEYWWLSVGGTTLLLMRKQSIGLLGSGPADIELARRVGAAFRVPQAGWRWRVWNTLARRGRAGR